jgi:hypothetical protein
MYSISQRANGVFAYFTTVLFTLLGAIALTSPFLLHNTTPSASVSSANILVKTGRLAYDSTASELGFVSFNLDAGTAFQLTQISRRSLIGTQNYSFSTWLLNTLLKHTYLYSNFYIQNVNQLVLWDAIITSKDDAQITLKNQKPKYFAYDMSTKLEYSPTRSLQGYQG